MSNEIIDPMKPGDVEPFLVKHPKPWVWSICAGLHQIEDANQNEITDLENLLRYIAYLEQDNERMRREHEPDSYCLYCNEGMLETDREFVDQRDSVHCSQECVDKAEAQW